MMTMLEAALWYADRGLPVFPCSPGSKVPFAGSSGSKDATTDEATIRKWWGKSPEANVAIATGSRSGVYVIDIDEASSEIMPRLPETWIARTRGGGWHYVYALPDGLALPNTAKSAPNALASDVDTRGEGGYILVWPSVVDGGRYEWINDIDPAPLPSWIVDKLTPRQTSMVVHRNAYRLSASSWAEKALADEVAALRATGEGGRNHALVRASFKLGQIAAAGHLSFGVAHDELAAVAHEWPNVKKSLGTIRRGLEAGAKEPRSPADNVREWRVPRISDLVYEPDEVMAPEPPRPAARSHEDEDAARWALLNEIRELGGLCDSFAGWVIRGADHAQPGLTIGALLALGSALAGRRLTYRRATSSLYVVALGGSGEGKGRPQSCLGRVIDQCWPALRGANSFSSGPAFVDGVRRAVNAGVATCLVLDEYGMQLQSVIGPRAASHRQDIKHSLTEISTKGTDKWSPALSLVKGGGKIDLIAPVVALLGSTTPESLHGVLTSTDVADGFVGRHLWMRTQHRLPDWQPVEGRGDDSIPIDVQAAIHTIRERHDAWHLGLPIVAESATDVVRVYDGVNMPEEDEAREILNRCKTDADAERREGKAGGTPPAVLARVPEFAARVALVLAALSQPEAAAPTVTAAVARLAVRVGQESARVFSDSLRANQRAGWDDPAAQVELVIGALHTHGGLMDWSDLLRVCRGLRARDLTDVVNRLVEEGGAVIEEHKTGGRPRRVIRLI